MRVVLDLTDEEYESMKNVLDKLIHPPVIDHERSNIMKFKGFSINLRTGARIDHATNEITFNFVEIPPGNLSPGALRAEIEQRVIKKQLRQTLS